VTKTTENSPNSEPDNGDAGAKTTLPEILSYDEIDRLLLAIEDIEDPSSRPAHAVRRAARE
jgi:hypothetical protein